MPTNDERRTIARRLRRCSPTLDNALTFFRVFEAVYGTLPEDGAAMGMPRRLATLIDRPTCRIGYVPGSADRSYSACGATFSTGTYQGGDHEEHEFTFCPNCGAEVVNDA